MKGFDYFMACYRKGVDLPVRIFTGLKAPANFYRPHALSFINLEVSEELPGHEMLALMNGMDVSIIAETLSDEVRELAKALISARPKHLVVCDGENMLSWAAHRGWK
jgi:hypothetical protein